MTQQVWLCGRSDEARVLSSVVGWACGSQIAVEHAEELRELRCRGHITTREHLLADGDGWVSYALTPSGFSRLKQIGGDELHANARKAHAWYRRNRAVVLAKIYGNG